MNVLVFASMNCRDLISDASNANFKSLFLIVAIVVMVLYVQSDFVITEKLLRT